MDKAKKKIVLAVYDINCGATSELATARIAKDENHPCTSVEEMTGFGPEQVEKHLPRLQGLLKKTNAGTLALTPEGKEVGRILDERRHRSDETRRTFWRTVWATLIGTVVGSAVTLLAQYCLG